MYLLSIFLIKVWFPYCKFFCKDIHISVQLWFTKSCLKIFPTQYLILNNNFLQYLLHYLRSLQAWFGEEEWNKYPVARTSLALLQDFHHSSAILNYPPNLIAIACINLSLQIYGVVVPLMDECDQQPWFNVNESNTFLILMIHNFIFDL